MKDNDCYDEFARWVQASHWYCTTRWALNGALKANPEAFGAVYPMEFRVPNCDEKDGQPTKTCHCSEGIIFIYLSKTNIYVQRDGFKVAWDTLATLERECEKSGMNFT